MINMAIFMHSTKFLVITSARMGQRQARIAEWAGMPLPSSTVITTSLQSWEPTREERSERRVCTPRGREGGRGEGWGGVEGDAGEEWNRCEEADR